jgi:hypothetical protein
MHKLKCATKCSNFHLITTTYLQPRQQVHLLSIMCCLASAALPRMWDALSRVSCDHGTYLIPFIPTALSPLLHSERHQCVLSSLSHTPSLETPSPPKLSLLISLQIHVRLNLWKLLESESNWFPTPRALGSCFCWWIMFVTLELALSRLGIARKLPTRACLLR